MGKSLTYNILEEHLVSGELKPGSEIGIRIDQTLTQDATGTMAYLQFEAMGIPRVRTKLSVSYVDHNMLQTGFENADDHRFLQSIAAKYGLYFSPPGNGICHQVHLERFAVPGRHPARLRQPHARPPAGWGCWPSAPAAWTWRWPWAAAPSTSRRPKVVRVRLSGQLQPWVSAKDIILELLRRLTVKGGVGRMFEYGGPGVESLSVPERATITNMGAELGATTSIFPSDERSREYLRAQKREEVWRALAADPDAEYDEVIEIDLDTLEPLVAAPSSPDAVVPVREVAGTQVEQVCVGCCTNSSYHDLTIVAAVLKGQTVHPEVSLTVTPGSRQVFTMIARNGALADLIEAGARILESACGPCIGMGQAPPTDGVSLRTFNRNFPGRSGTPDDQRLPGQPGDGGGHRPARRHHRPPRPGPDAARRVPRRVHHRRRPDHPAQRAPGGGGGRPRAEHQAPAHRPAAARDHPRAGPDQGGRQHHHRPHPAGGRQDPAAALQHPRHLRVRLRLRRPRLRSAGQSRPAAASSSAARNYGQGSSREHAALAPDVPGREGGDRQVLRPHPPRRT